MKSFTDKTAKSLLRGNIAAIVMIVAMCEFIIILAGTSVIFLNPDWRQPGTWNIFFVSLGITLVVSWMAALYFTRKLRQDMKSGDTGTISSKVASVEEVTDYEAGSAALYIPVLGDLFPKLFNKEMRHLQYKKIITENHCQYEVPADFNIQINDAVILHFGKRSELYLGCEVS